MPCRWRGRLGKSNVSQLDQRMTLADQCLLVANSTLLTVASRSPGPVFFTLRFLRSFSAVASLSRSAVSAQGERCLTTTGHPILPDPQPSIVFDHFGVVLIEPRDGGE